MANEFLQQFLSYAEDVYQFFLIFFLIDESEVISTEGMRDVRLAPVFLFTPAAPPWFPPATAAQTAQQSLRHLFCLCGQDNSLCCQTHSRTPRD